jgi:hypothetical protein
LIAIRLEPNEGVFDIIYADFIDCFFHTCITIKKLGFC